METIASPSELSQSEWHRVGRTLRRRFPATDAGVVGVGFGVAEKGSAADPGRGHAACFLVLCKGDPPTRRGRIPDVAAVRVRRGGRFVELRLATDVIEVDPTRWELTRRTIRHVSVSQTSAASNLIAWRTPFDDRERWGTVTVGHPFWGVARVPDPEPRVRMTVPTNRTTVPANRTTVPNAGTMMPAKDSVAGTFGGVPATIGRQDETERRSDVDVDDRAGAGRRRLELHGRLLARSGRRDRSGVDAALIGFDEREPRDNAWVSEGEAARLRARSIDELPRDVMRAGTTRTVFGEIPFVVRRYYPEFSLIAEVGRIRDVIEVESVVPAAFAPGSSGNVWTIEGQPACLQFAGYVDPASPSLSYRRGIGQPLTGVLDWARGRLASGENVSTNKIDLRLASLV